MRKIPLGKWTTCWHPLAIYQLSHPTINQARVPDYQQIPTWMATSRNTIPCAECVNLPTVPIVPTTPGNSYTLPPMPAPNATAVMGGTHQPDTMTDNTNQPTTICMRPYRPRPPINHISHHSNTPPNPPMTTIFLVKSVLLPYATEHTTERGIWNLPTSSCEKSFIYMQCI